MLMRAFPLVSLTLASSLCFVACGRTSPDGGTDVAEIEATARAVAFDTEVELTDLLDDDYTTDAEVTVIATGVATDIATQVTGDAIAALPLNDLATFNADLRAELDPVYLAFDTTILNVGDVEDTAKGVCFDTEAELTAELDDQYLPIDFLPDFGDLQNVPADLADGDDNTVAGVTGPLELNGTTLAIDTAGCVNGEALVFQGGSFSCLTPTVPSTPAGASAVGAAALNTRPFEALPIIIKAEGINVAAIAANSTQDILVYNGANPPPRNMLLVDAWAVATTVTGAPTWHLREAAANDLTTPVPLGAAGDVTRIIDFNNAAQRNIAVGDTLQVRMTADADGNDTATFTVYILAIPL